MRRVDPAPDEESAETLFVLQGALLRTADEERTTGRDSILPAELNARDVPSALRLAAADAEDDRSSGDIER